MSNGIYKQSIDFRNEPLKLKVQKNRAKMKIFQIVAAAALGQKSNTASKRNLLRVDLETNLMLRRLEKSIGLYNLHNHHQKREITFDPTALGCKWSSKQALSCKHAHVSSTVGGRFIYPRKSH